jgi:hypothetical protein
MGEKRVGRGDISCPQMIVSPLRKQDIPERDGGDHQVPT